MAACRARGCRRPCPSHAIWLRLRHEAVDPTCGHGRVFHVRGAARPVRPPRPPGGRGRSRPRTARWSSLSLDEAFADLAGTQLTHGPSQGVCVIRDEDMDGFLSPLSVGRLGGASHGEETRRARHPYSRRSTGNRREPPLLVVLVHTGRAPVGAGARSGRFPSCPRPRGEVHLPRGDLPRGSSPRRHGRARAALTRGPGLGAARCREPVGLDGAHQDPLVGLHDPHPPSTAAGADRSSRDHRGRGCGPPASGGRRCGSYRGDVSARAPLHPGRPSAVASAGQRSPVAELTPRSRPPTRATTGTRGEARPGLQPGHGTGRCHARLRGFPTARTPRCT